MTHRLVQGIEKAFGWSDSRLLGSAFSHGKMSDSTLCERLLSPSKLLDIVMRRSLTYPQFRCLQDGKDLHPSGYLSTMTTGRGQNIEVADMRRLGQLLQAGCTLILDDVGPLDATLEVACRAVQWWAGELTRVNIYLTTQDASGFGLHWDVHDVIVVQLAGEKCWEVRGPSRLVPMERDAERNSEPSTDVLWSGTMETGDAMHIPRGYWHQATRTGRGGGFSMHATFGLTQRTGVDWLTWLADQSRANELFRHDLDGWGTPEERHAEERELVKAATQLLASRSPSEYLATRIQEQARPRHVPTVEVFGRPTIVVCVTDFPPHVELQGGNVVLLTAGKKITLAVEALPALRLFLDGNPVDVQEVCVASGVDASTLAEMLVTEGVCAQVSPELASGYVGLLGGAEKG